MNLQAFIDALTRYLHMVIRPEEEWNLVVAQNPSAAEAVFPFSIIGLILSALSFLIGVALRIGDKSILIETLAHVFVDAGSVAAFAVASGFVSTRVDAVRPSMGAMVALYSATGIWLISLLNFVPLPILGWLWLLMGSVYTGYLYYRSLDLAVGVPAHRRLYAFLVPMGTLVGVNGIFRLILEFVL
jgi:hypothetical protein